MKKILFLTAILTSFSLTYSSPAETASSSEAYNPHTAANECYTTTSESTEYLEECEQLCSSCHSTPIKDLDLSGSTEWNPNGVTLGQAYPEQTIKELIVLGDGCFDCHGEKFSAGHNHPVDIQYLPVSKENDLIESPEGPFLVCKAENDCQVRCVTCHDVHPSADEGQQVAGLLRMKNNSSALCASCHAIAGSSAST